MRLPTATYHSAAIIHLCAQLLISVACAARQTPAGVDRLTPCTSDTGPVDAYCGSLSVFENRDTRSGRTINLTIVALPALSNNPKPDPLFFLAGGPGQGAAQMAKPLREVFRRVQTDRDIVLVDQRGTGRSRPLNCKSNTDSLREISEPEGVGLNRLRECLKHYDADPRLYTTPIAMDDLDDVRSYLGYERINVYGGSYGTRGALVYLRQHEPHVRSVVLDGVAPTDMRLPLFFARDAQRALDLLTADCDADATCRTLYPNLSGRVRALLEHLDRDPVRARLTHPRTGIEEDVTIDVRFVTAALFGALYSPLASSLVPALIDRAERGDFQSLLALALRNESPEENMSIGMQMSVLCAEDAARITPEDAVRESSGTLFGRHLFDTRMKVCEFWPKGQVPADYYQPVTSSVPVLILSGALDPVTPPGWGDTVARTLPHSRHLIAPGTGHGVITTACGVRLIRDFLNAGRADAVDAGCLTALHRPPFFLTPAGPDPTARGTQP